MVRAEVEQVEHVRLTPRVESACVFNRFQLLEKYIPFNPNIGFQTDSTTRAPPYTVERGITFVALGAFLPRLTRVEVGAVQARPLT